jgi:hypothetical protein
MVISSPMGYLANSPATGMHTPGRELAALAIQRMSANDPRAAAL